MELLSIHGTNIGEPFVKYLGNDIWELRPLRNRILFASWVKGQFIILHHFIKKTQKTPKPEIERARGNLKDFLEREDG